MGKEWQAKESGRKTAGGRSHTRACASKEERSIARKT